MAVSDLGQERRKRTMSGAQSHNRQPSSSQARQPQRQNNAESTVLSDEENQKLLQWAAAGFGALIALKVLSSAIFLYFILLPVLYFYMLQTCPSDQSFEAKKELKRVMRGHHLPEDHPDKPKGILEQTMARVAATVTTELATGLGYEVRTIQAGGAMIIKTVRVPSVAKDYYWVGAFSRWTFVYSQNLEDSD